MSNIGSYHPQCVEAAQKGQIITICPECLFDSVQTYYVEMDDYPVQAQFYAIDDIADNTPVIPQITYIGSSPTKSSIWDRPGLRGFK